ncbi:extracellular solute-binding protein [Haloplanus salinarum]|uniref:extracellular solute-binding protein n=1 Tax=Haloplanus salinarum TaxID=1912324 RepID=UPI00214C2BF0|nr:extracellular solute-binding protein [Haloplanus salinarum]
MSQETIDRRRFIRATGAAATVTALAGCSGGGGGGGGDGGDGGSESTPPGEDVEPADSIQYVGENTPPTKALRSITDRFTEETGIEVEYTLQPLLNYTETVASDLTSEAGNYDAMYVDPYNIGAPYYTDLEPLNAYIEDNDYDYEDHIEIHRIACSEYEGDGTIRGLPYDCPTILLAYRGDVFDEYGDQATSDLGFEAEPNPDMTWSQYMEVAKWINENVPDDVVEYGTGHMAKQHQSLANEFEMIQWSFGGTQLEGFDGKDPILPDDISAGFTDDASIEAAEFYQELVTEVAAPGSTTWNWSGVAEAFAGGNLAMAPEWHEFNGMFADPEASDVADSVRWTLAPTGPAENRNVQAHYGGSSVGINRHISPEKKKAAWMFIEWATSEEVQTELLKQAGGTPTRQSVYDRSEVEEASQMPASESPMPNVVPPILEGWDLDNVGQRPHHPDWLQLEEVIYSEGSAMVSGDQSAEATMQDCADGFSNIL